MANITLKDVNGNNIYPEVDVSTLSGTIEYGETGFTKGGDVYDALGSKADLSDIPKFRAVQYCDEDYSDYHLSSNKNMHKITKDDLTAKGSQSNEYYFYMKLPLEMSGISKYVQLMGSIYGARILEKGSTAGSYTGRSLTSSYITSMDIMLGGTNGNPITDEPIIRRIDSSEFVTSDRHYNDSSKTGQCIYHFTHFGAASTNMQAINAEASNLLVKINLPQTTTLKEGDIFEIFIGWIEF